MESPKIKASICLLTMDRVDETRRSLGHNMSNCGLCADEIELLWCSNSPCAKEVHSIVRSYNPVYSRMNSQNEGIPKSFNQLTLRSKGDLIFLMADDILMPDNWLAKMIEYSKLVKNPGVIGIECTMTPNPGTMVDGIYAHYAREGQPKDYCIYGPMAFTREAGFDVGLQCENMSLYGLCDSHFGLRMIKSGRTSFYIPGLKSEHLGIGKADEGEYRAFKNAELSKAYNTSRHRFENMDSTNYREPIPEMRDPL